MVFYIQEVIMAYFLKKSKLKKGLYLQIYESFYNPEKKGTSHRSYQALGYVNDLIASGIEDPVAHFSSVVSEMNLAANKRKEQDKMRKISDSPERYLGYFLLKAVFNYLQVANYLDLMQSVKGFRFQIANLLQALVYSRTVSPCSKRKTLADVFPKLFGNYTFSYDQVLEGVEYLGMEYEKVIEIFNHQVSKRYGLQTKTTYFDCTNFYFEIDKEDWLRKRGPSKENRKDPIIGLGLLLDANQLPIGMKLYPGNESEKPVIREVIRDLKTRNQITGRTVQVADKGLNCAQNIITALKQHDGYLFSKPVKTLPETEKTWLLLENDYREIRGKDGQLLYKIKECIDEFPYRYTDEAGNSKVIMLKEKRVVTYNPKLAEKKRYEIHKQVEKAKYLKASHAKRQEYGDSSKYVTFSSTDENGRENGKKVKVTLNQKAIDRDLLLAGYNLLVTSEVNMTADEIHKTYHNLWRIEESFKMMKTYLDARPVYLQKPDSIKGHFLICYLSVLLLRLLQFKVFDDAYCSEQLINFIRDFRVVEANTNQYINLMASNDFAKELADKLNLPITNYFLDRAQIKKMLSHCF